MTTNSQYANLTGKQFAGQILDSLQQDIGVDLHAILLDDTIDPWERQRRASAQLLEALFERARNSNEAEEFFGAETDDREFLRAFAAGEVDIEPNLVIQMKNVPVLRGYRGNDIKDYLYSLTKRFENMSKTKTPGQLALEIVGSGLISVSISMAVQTYKAWKAGATLLAALRTGITNIGMKTAIAVVVVALVALLTWLILENPKKLLGMVINDTDSTLVVNDWRKGVDGGKGGDLWMNHGAMVSFPQDYENGDLTKKIQIQKRAFFGPGDEDNACYAGLFFIDKNAGFYGTEGIAIYSATEGSTRFAHTFACPYSDPNGTAVKVLNGQKDVQALFHEMYRQRKVVYETTEGGFTLSSAVNDASGGVTGCITYFGKA